jgi:hypothetical protein
MSVDKLESMAVVGVKKALQEFKVKYKNVECKIDHINDYNWILTYSIKIDNDQSYYTSRSVNQDNIQTEIYCAFRPYAKELRKDQLILSLAGIE